MEVKYPVINIPVKWSEAKDEISFDFEGTGFVVKGETAKWGSTSSFVYNTELYIDGSLVERPQLPASYTTRRYEICWKYDLPKGKHTVRLKILNSEPESEFRVGEAIIYSDKPVNGPRANVSAAK